MIWRSGRTHQRGKRTEKPQNLTTNRGSTTTWHVSAICRIFPPPGQSGSPGLVEGCYRPVNTAALLKFPFTPDTFACLEESIKDMPLLTSSWGVDSNLTVDGHNEVYARSRGWSHLLRISARHHNIMILDKFSQVGHQRQEDVLELRCRCKISRHRQRRCHCRGRVQKKAYKGGIWQKYDHSAK